MGFRIDIKNESNTLNFYGTKLYGYTTVPIETLESFKYLKEIGVFTDEENWIECVPYTENYILTADQFRHFIYLYNEELKNSISSYGPVDIFKLKEIIDLYEDEENKVISWG